MKKWMLAVLSCCLVLTMTVVGPDSAEAKRGGYKSNIGTFKKQDTKANNNVSNSQTTNNNANKTGAATTGTQKGGGFFGGGFMKGLMIGGLAGMLFGGLLGGLGFFGEMLGLLINLLAIFFVVILAMNVYHAFKKRKEEREKKILP